MSRRSALAFGALVLFIAAAAGTAGAEDVRKAIDAGNAAFRTAFLAGNARAVAECYTSNAMVVPAGAPIATGRTAIAAYWQGGIDAGVKNLSLETSSVEDSGDFAVEDGTVKVTGTDGAVSSSRYVVVWKREGGTWKIHRDIWNAAR